MNNTIHKGKVKFYNTEHAYGFIKDLDTNKEYFVHVSGLIDSIKKDEIVTFELTTDKRGEMAINVRTVDKYIIINIDNK